MFRVISFLASPMLMAVLIIAVGGFKQFDDFDLFENLVAALPELELVFLAESDENYLYVAVKPDNKHEEEAILVDLRKIVQVIV